MSKSLTKPTTSSLDATNYRPRRDHRHTINAWNKTREEKKRRKNHFDLGTAVHEIESAHVPRPTDPKTNRPIRPAHEFDVCLEPDSYTEEKYRLFENYQRNVHQERPYEISTSGFKRFLCSGLGQNDRMVNGINQRLGSYHQCYRLDGRLVAMGVVDLLPGCVSSVYLMYHQDVQDWYFGKLSALREISLAIQGGYKYYYMDSETYDWDLLDEDHLARLSARKYVSMSMERHFHLPPNKVTNVKELGLSIDTGDQQLVDQLDYYQEDHRPLTDGLNSALAANMPGLMSFDELQRVIPLGRWKVKLGNQGVFHLEDLKGWAEWDINDPSSPKRAIAELAAALGPELVEKFVISFR
ncbi:MAG: hypothetical protein Q9224_001875 [Gallowayella concinna]